MPYVVRVTWAEGQYQGTSPTTISANVGNAVANGGGQAAVATSVVFGVGAAAAAGSGFLLGENVALPMLVGDASAAGQAASVAIYSIRVTWAEAEYEASAGGTTVPLSVGNAVASGPSGATVSEDITLVAATGNAAAAGAVAAVNASVTLPLQVGNAVATGLTASISVFNPNITIGCLVGNADAAGQRCQVLPPLTVAPSATPGYAPKTRYRVRVGSRWMEVDPLDPMSVRRAYDAAQEDAQDAATQDVEVPAAVAAQAVVVQPIKGPDYAGLAKEARRISEDIRKVYADALQTALIARLMREQIERDDEDDIAVLLASI
jgi:hypothetical protein